MNATQDRMQVRVFLAEGDPADRQSLRELLERETNLAVVGEAEPTRDGLAQVLATDPDVLVAHLDAPDPAVELCRELLSTRPTIRCVVVTSLGEDEALLQAILVGAADYVTAQAGGDIAGAVRRGSVGTSSLDARIREYLDRKGRKDPDELLQDLTNQQQRVAELVAEGRTNAEIADELDLSVNTVRNYLGHVMKKLRARNRTEVAVVVATLAERRRWLAGRAQHTSG